MQVLGHFIVWGAWAGLELCCDETGGISHPISVLRAAEAAVALQSQATWSGTQLSLAMPAGCVLFLLPGALACANVHFWSANRNDLLAVSRLASMAVYAAYAYVVVPHNVDGSSALLCALCRTGVCCMLICALR